MAENFSNIATPKYLGYVYQVLIAIEQCFQAKKNETIWIECFGDIYDGNTSTEVKHHFEKTNLSSSSVDFWKTLKTLVTEDTFSFNSLILHTTARIPDNSIFYGWNEQTKTNKYKRLKNHSPTDSIKSYYNATITNYNKNDLLSILEKLSIKSSQLSIEDKWDDLIEDRIFYTIPDQYKEDAFFWVYGYVEKQAINDRYNWQIKINDFNKACAVSLRKFTQDRIPFPSFKRTEVENSERNFLFIREMKKIELKDKPIERAISDYLRAKKSEIKLLEYEPITMPEILDKYDDSVLDNLESLKTASSEKIKKQDIGNENANSISRELFHKSTESPHIDIAGVADTQKYYRDGRIHHNVNERKFFWRFCDEELV